MSSINKDCLCLVTGASSGIGLATCQKLTEYGAKVVGCGRNQEALEKLKAKGEIFDYVVADLTKDGECFRVVAETVKIFDGRLTTIVNSAGGLRGGAVGDGADLENYQYNMKINTQVPFEIIHHSVPYLKEEGSIASIINVSSVNGKQSFANCASYCMSKAAVDQLTKCASVDLAKFGIRVNAVNPGVVKTNIHRTSGMDEEQYQAFLKRSIDITHPISAHLGRVGEPEEVAELIAFLASNKATFLTGECIAIDGGRQNLGAR